MGKKRKRNQRNASIQSLATSPNFSNTKQKTNQFPTSSSLNGRQLSFTHSAGDSNHNFNNQGGPFTDEVSHLVYPNSFELSNNSYKEITLQGNYGSNCDERFNMSPFNSNFSPRMSNQSEQMEMMRTEIMELRRKLNFMEDAQNRAKNRNLSLEIGRNWPEERNVVYMENYQDNLQDRNYFMEDTRNMLQKGNLMHMTNPPSSLQDRNLLMEDLQSSSQNRNFSPREPTSLAELLKDVPYVSPFTKAPKAEKKLESYYNSMPKQDLKKTNVSNKQATFKVPTKVFKKPSTSNNQPAKASNRLSSSNKPAQASNNRLASSNKPAQASNRPASSNNKPAQASNRLASSNNKPAQASNRLASSNTKPAQANNRLASSNNKPSQASNRLASSNNKPAQASNSPSNNKLAQASNRLASSNNKPAQASNRLVSSNNKPVQASNMPVSSNNIPTKASNKSDSNALPLQSANKRRKKSKKSRKGANNPANASNTMPTKTFTNSASKFNKQNNRPNFAKSVKKPIWKTYLNSGPLPLTQFSSELGLVTSSSGLKNDNWIRTNIDDGLLPTPRLYQGTNLGQNRFHSVNPRQSTLALTAKTYQRPLSEDSHNWLSGSDYDADLSLEMLQIKQQNVEDQLNELDKRSQEMEQNLILSQNEYFLDF